MERRTFVKKIALGSLLLGQLRLTSACAGPVRKYTFRRSGIPAETAHLVRSKQTDGDPPVVRRQRIIIGAGISGLSVAYHLHQAHENDFLVLEMEEQIGGNAQFGETKAGKFPQGAHYLPIQNLENKPLLDFLHRSGSVTHFSHDGIPYYNELELCHEPEDRLLIFGKWHSGIAESLVQLHPGEKPVWDRFFELMDAFRNYKGKDGKDVFFIPQSMASEDHDLLYLDQVSFREYLDKQKLRTDSLDWYLDYCCRDDYGQDTRHISAFAGIHYFAARKGAGKNTEMHAQLTWPEGNGHLAAKLAEDIRPHIQTGMIVRSIGKTTTGNYLIAAFNWLSKQLMCYEAQEIVVAVPRHVRPWLLSEIQPIDWLMPTHQPWWVATVELEPFPDFSGVQLSWDNVVFNHPTLGYIYNLNQQMERPNGNSLFTFYKPLDRSEAKENRHTYLRKSDDELKKEIVADMESIYPGIESYIRYMEVRVWGHGMVSPGIGYVTSKERQLQQQAIDGSIHFAHTDDIGFSLFEEAFDIGYRVAQNIINSAADVDSL